MPSFEDVVTAQTQDIAEKLADIFYDNSEYDPEKDTRALNKDGYNQMADLFGSIQDTYRADVFVALIQELDRRGLRFNVQQFQEEAVH